MTPRRVLSDKLHAVMGQHKVYFQPPETVKLTYPCIVYNMEPPLQKYADNNTYFAMQKYSGVLIDPEADSSYYPGLLGIEHLRVSRIFRADGLYHFAFDVYI